MSQAKLLREPQRQLGQFFTPPSVAKAIMNQLRIGPDGLVMEPSLGTGSFVFALLDAIESNHGSEHAVLWAHTHLYGCEIDQRAMAKFAAEWSRRGLGNLPENIERGDFFRWLPPDCDRRVALDRRLYLNSSLEFFDLIVGNPPFGGSIDPSIEDNLDSIFGVRNGMKIKKETYAFFLLKCVDLLKPGGRLCFICSDTILTISTMRGLRCWLQDRCQVEISAVPGEFNDTAQDLVLITLVKQGQGQRRDHIRVFGSHTRLADVEATPNCSWRVSSEYSCYFGGQLLGDKFVASSGMTIGNNDLFLRKITNGFIEEQYEFSFGKEPITLARELARARLGKLSEARKHSILECERRGDTSRVVSWIRLQKPVSVKIPHGDYLFYNKATREIIYSEPRWVIFWRNNGDYVYTYKKMGKWYLHGVGGKPYFGREGLTWSLIASRMRTRWLPPGYILDSGAPCAFLRSGVEHDELFFVMGWTLTDLCTRILKNVVNHTRNIQSKDFERLPYPDWTAPRAKDAAISRVKELVRAARAGKRFSFDSPDVKALNELYEYRSDCERMEAKESKQLSTLFPL